MFDTPEPEKNLPKLQIFNTCPLVVNAIKACTYDKPRDNKPAEDVAEFEGDDPYDTLRYLCDAADRYFDDASIEMGKMQRQEELVRRLENTNDWTAFYMGMRRVENDQNAVQPVKRYHKAARM